MAQLSKLVRYELRRILGKGAMGVVYEGFDPVLNRRVAVKTILKSVALDEETQRDYSVRFVREAQAVARLNHPHIVQVHDFGEHEEIAYLVMEFIEGRELRAFFDEGMKFETDEAVRIMRELLDALEFAHEKNVIHRDVKPANVMLDAQRQVKLADFGVARVQDSDRSAAGTMVGTPAFMSPEQISGGKIDRRTDVFSAGVVLYQLLTGEQPFKGKGAWTVAKQIMQDDPTPPSELVSNISPVYDALIDKALAKSPAERFASAREFRAALRSALKGETVASAQATVRLEAEARAKLKAAEEKVRQEAAARAKAAVDEDATVAIGNASPVTAPAAPAERKSSYALPALAAVAMIAAGIGAFLILGRTQAPAPVAQAPAPPKVEAPAPPKAELSAADIEKISKETEERIRREYADKSAAEQAKAMKAVADKVVQEKQLAVKAAAEKAAAERAAAEKATRIATEKAVEEKAAAAKAAEEKAATAKATEEKIAAARAAEKSAAAKAPPVSVAAAAAVAPARDGVRPGRYAFRVSTGAGLWGGCSRVGFQEDIEIPAGSSQGISGREFNGLQFLNTQDGLVSATVQSIAGGRFVNHARLSGRATAAGYAGTYEWGGGNTGCTGQWTLVRK